jgi:hypothetical protein
MADRLVFAWRDYDNDRQQITLDMTEATDLGAEYASIKTELDKWLIGADAGGGYYEELTADAKAAASSPIAQSASQAICEYRDTVTGGTYTKRFPFPDLTKADDGQIPPEKAFLAAGGVTIFNPDHTDYPLLVAALENAWQSPNGNFIQVVRVYIEE